MSKLMDFLSVKKDDPKPYAFQNLAKKIMSNMKTKKKSSRARIS